MIPPHHESLLSPPSRSASSQSCPGAVAFVWLGGAPDADRARELSMRLNETFLAHIVEFEQPRKLPRCVWSITHMPWKVKQRDLHLVLGQLEEEPLHRRVVAALLVLGGIDAGGEASVSTPDACATRCHLLRLTDGHDGTGHRRRQRRQPRGKPLSYDEVRVLEYLDRSRPVDDLRPIPDAPGYVPQLKAAGAGLGKARDVALTKARGQAQARKHCHEERGAGAARARNDSASSRRRARWMPTHVSVRSNALSRLAESSITGKLSLFVCLESKE